MSETQWQFHALFHRRARSKVSEFSFQKTGSNTNYGVFPRIVIEFSESDESLKHELG